MRLVQRARLIESMLDDPKLTATEAGKQVGFKSSGSGVFWVRRFNEEGLDGLEDKPRDGRHLHGVTSSHSVGPSGDDAARW